METEDVNALEETLKWGEPSYLTKGGITLRMDWKDRALDRYEMYFNCNTSLVDTFKEVYGDVFTFEGNRAIVWQGRLAKVVVIAVPDPDGAVLNPQLVASDLPARRRRPVAAGPW